MGSWINCLTTSQFIEPEAEAPMKRYSMILIAVMMFAVGLSAADANAGTRCVGAGGFPMMLGVGY